MPNPAPVVDEYEILRPSEVAKLTRTLKEIKQKKNVEITIFIASSLREREIADFSIAVATQWKLGRKKEDKGLLILVAPKERKMRFEVGYGLEGDLTDATTRRIQDQILRPYFRSSKYYDGLMQALLAVQEKVPLGLEGEVAPPPSGKKEPANIAVVLFIILVVIVIIIRILTLFGSGRYYSGGGGWGDSGGSGGWGGGSSSSGGDSWGGGGGGFGGGGSSSDW